MRSNDLSPRLLAPLALLALPALSSAQGAPFHASARDSFEQPSRSYSDVWAHGDQGYIGRFGTNQFDIVDLANPDALTLTRNVVIPSPNNGCSAQDIKVGRSVVDPSTILAFVAFESSGPDALGIYDVTNPTSPGLLTTVQPNVSLYQTSHNLSYREDGWLVVANSFSSSVAVIDLRSYDPANAPSRITSATYLLNNLGSGFVHDLTLTDGYLYLAEWDSLQVWDASDLASGPPAFRGQVRGYSCHAVWPSDDAAYIVTTDERSGGSLRLWTMTDDGSVATIEQTDSFVAADAGAGASYSAHNPVLLGDRIYTSYYGAGVTVHQIDRTDDTMELVARFDTSSAVYSSGFAGCWGVYPFLGEENVVASDQSNGLFTLDFSALQFRSTSPRPRTLIPFETTPLTVEVDELGAIALDPSTVEVHTSVDGGAFAATPMTPLGGNAWRADLPALGCGSKVDYYFSASATSGEAFTRPSVVNARVFTAYSTLSPTVVFADDFRTDKGWTVTNDGSLSSGTWERGTPVETGFQPGYDDADDVGNACYVTENGSPGGSTSNDDVDGGPTRLLSPVLDFSDGDGIVSFSAWQACSEPDTLDALTVDVSNTGGGSWQPVMTIQRKSGGWNRYSFRVSDFVTPNGNVRVRFVIQDNPNDSVTEAGIDHFVAESLCTAPAASVTFQNGSGSNGTCFATSPPVLGQSWVSTIDHAANPGADLTLVMIYQSAGSGLFGVGGEFLVDLGSVRYFQSLRPATGSVTTHTASIPSDVSFAGRTAAAQGAVLGGVPGGYELCNGYQLLVGF